MTETETNIFLIRHGDRLDYADKSWLKKAKENDALISDPPLSPLGHRQARETAQDLHRQGLNVEKILCSPYLRVIQTACPTAEVFNLPLCIESGLAEAQFTPNHVPSARERFPYFHQIDTSYQPTLPVEVTPGFACRKTGFPCEAFAGHYTQRMGKFARQIESMYRGKTIVCFSHAASVALVAALLKSTIRGLKFAPCGIYHLQKKGAESWQLITSGETNPHVSENSSTTFAWGFDEYHFEDTESSSYHGSKEGIGLDYFVDS